MRIGQRRPGKEHKGLFNELAIFHSQRVRGQQDALLNRLTRVFNECSTPASLRKNVPIGVIFEVSKAATSLWERDSGTESPKKTEQTE
jgi:hypothetical protein